MTAVGLNTNDEGPWAVIEHTARFKTHFSKLLAAARKPPKLPGHQELWGRCWVCQRSGSGKRTEPRMEKRCPDQLRTDIEKRGIISHKTGMDGYSALEKGQGRGKDNDLVFSVDKYHYRNSRSKSRCGESISALLFPNRSQYAV